MKSLQIFCLLIFFIFLLRGFDSFSQQPVFTLVPSPGGECGTQDPMGYMWFGLNGLHRYDGYSYKSYFNDPLNPSSLVFNQIESICADRKGFIWLGTKGNGLGRLDPETGIFTHFRHNPSNPTSISNDTIKSILEDKDGKIAGQQYEPTVSISTKKINGKIEVKVKDNGNGIPQKVLDKIFQPFFTTKPTGQGTGLGLSLTYDIVIAHGGELKAETREKEGAEFIIILPLK